MKENSFGHEEKSKGDKPCRLKLEQAGLWESLASRTLQPGQEEYARACA
jgi:hypothetical protein